MTDKEAIEAIEGVLAADYHYDESIKYQLTSDDLEWLEKAEQALQEREERGKGCEHCKDEVLIFRKINCNDCTEIQDGEWCGKLKKCPPPNDDWVYLYVSDDKHNFCPICGSPLKGANDFCSRGEKKEDTQNLKKPYKY